MVFRSCPIFLALLACVGCQSSQASFYEREAVMRCLPPDVSLDDVVHAYSPVDKFTVEHELIDLGAHVDKDGKLVDAGGKEIRFYREKACLGDPSKNYEDARRQEAEQVAKFSEEFTVVTISANPTAIPTQ